MEREDEEETVKGVCGARKKAVELSSRRNMMTPVMGEELLERLSCDL